MRQLFIGKLLFLLLSIPLNSNAQTSIGLEVGLNFAGNSPSPRKTLFLRSLHPGLDGGLFIEKAITKRMAIRTSLLYTMRFFLYGKRDSSFINAYRALHCITLPVLVSFKANSKLSFDFGIEIIGIVTTDLPSFSTPAIHLGLKAAIAYQITPVLALRLYGVYDLIKIRQDSSPNNFNYYNSISLGLKLAYTFKRIKKRRIIRSPGI